MKTEVHYIGVDLGKQSSYFVVKDETGRLQGSMKVFNNSTVITQALLPYRKFPCRAVMEATTNYYWMYQVLTQWGCEVTLAHPLKTRAIADAKVKNDRLDANILCDLLRGGLIPPSYIPTEEVRSEGGCFLEGGESSVCPPMICGGGPRKIWVLVVEAGRASYNSPMAVVVPTPVVPLTEHISL